MPRHVIEGEELVIQDTGTPFPTRRILDFTGVGVSVADNSGTETTEVTVSAGGSSFAVDNWVIFNKSGLTSLAVGDRYDIGTISDQGAGFDLFGNTFHNAAQGILEIKNTGLYVFSQLITAIGSLPAAPATWQVSTGTTWQNWGSVTHRSIGNSTPANGQVMAQISFTDTFVAGEGVWNRCTALVASGLTYSVETYMARLL
jgi:hypothetical protein